MARLFRRGAPRQRSLHSTLRDMIKLRVTVFHVLLVLLMIGASAGCQTPESNPDALTEEPATLDQAEVDSFRTAYMDAYAAQDAEAAVNLFAPDAHLIGTMEHLEGTEAIRNNFQNAFGMGVNAMEIDPQETILVGSEVWETGSYTVRGQTADGQPLDQEGKYVALLTREEGAWKIHRLVTYIPAPPEGAAVDAETATGE